MTKKKAKLEVVVTSTIEHRLPISYLTPLQGNLKTLSDEAYGKLKKSILKHGFQFPIFIWENFDDGITYIIDGHMRYNVLMRMKEDGYTIPQLPVVIIEAKDIQDAKEKLVAAASQYGKFDEKGVAEFFSSFDVPPLDIAEIPWLSQPIIEDIQEFPQQTTTVRSHERSLDVDLNAFEKFEHQCPKCGHEWSVK